MASKLAVALEKGKNVKGMVGYVPIKSNAKYDDDSDVIRDGTVYVKVRCLGLTTGEGCGLKVRVKLYAGEGELAIAPCRWLDSPGDIKAAREAAARLAKAELDFNTISEPHFIPAKRTMLEKYVAKNLNGKDKDFYAHVKEITGKDLKDSLASVPKHQLEDLAKVAVLVANDVKDVTADNLRWRF